MTYDFKDQLRIGKEAEVKLDALFSKWYQINEIPIEIEKLIHADRLFIKPSGEQLIIEYKADFMGHQTSNLIVEIESVDTNHTPGWALTSKADMLVWWVAGTGQVLAIPFPELRQQILSWRSEYRIVRIPNKGYHTVGIAVPIFELQRIAIWSGKL